MRRSSKKDPSQKSRVVSARLHPEHEYEGAALDILDALIAQGYETREIITDALLHMEGRTPEMYHRERDVNEVLDSLQDLPTITQKIDNLSDFITHRIAELLSNIKREDPAAFRDFANDEDDTGGFDPAFMENAKKAARKTFKQRFGDD